jgi:UDP-glucuronate decarboxylase
VRRQEWILKTILVAGGAGFIGAHLCRRLSTAGGNVICVDNLHTGRLSNIKDLVDSSKVSFIEFDVESPLINNEKMDGLIGETVDEIYNFACPASPIHYQKNPIKTIRTNVIGTMNLLELARRHQAKFFQASTSEVYGDPLVHPQNEYYWGNVNPIGIRACYDEGKRCAEALCMEFIRFYGVDVRIARIFNTYGPGMDPSDGRAVSNFITQALLTKSITIFGNGTQTRSFCYIDDMVDGIVRLMHYKGIIQDPINLGNPEEYSILDVAKAVIESTGATSKIDFLPLPLDDPTKRKPDITLANKLLNWAPKTNLREGLEKTWVAMAAELLDHRS